MSESTDPLAWIHRAEEDWLLACSALRRKVPLIYGATFHAQQCAEKYLKALLVSRQQAFPRTHDVVSRCTTYVGGMASISLSIRTSQSAYPHMRSKHAIQGKSPPQTKPGKRCRLRRQCADRPEQYCGHLLGNRNFCGVASGRWLGKTRASGGGSAVHVSSNDTLACHGGHTR
jgi:hypothetical protein